MLVSVEFRGEEFGFGGGVDCAYGAGFGFEIVAIKTAEMRCPDINFPETDRAFFCGLNGLKNVANFQVEMRVFTVIGEWKIPARSSDPDRAGRF